MIPSFPIDAARLKKAFKGTRLAPGGILVTWDPALRANGLAFWRLDHREGRDVAGYVGCSAVYNPQPAGAASAAALVMAEIRRVCGGVEFVILVERMQDYGGKSARAAALADVREVVTHVRAQTFGRVVQPFTPGVWKGQIPKDVHHGRLRRMFPEAWDPRGPLTADTWDAIGLGLYALGVVGKGGIRRGTAEPWSPSWHLFPAGGAC